MNDPLAFLPPLALLVQIVACGVLEKLVVDALFFFGEFDLDFELDVRLLSIGWRRAPPRRVGPHDDDPWSNDRAAYRQLR